MKIPHLWIGIASGVVVILAALTISIAHTHEVAVKNSAANAATSAPAFTVTALHDAYKKGVHTVTGTVATPTPCYIVTATETVSASPARLRVDLAIPADTGMCLDLPQQKPFSVSGAAAAGVPIDVYVNGTLATSTSA